MVLDPHRGHGVGFALLGIAESTFTWAGGTKVSLQLSRRNDVAQAFYHRQGYSEQSGYELLDKALRDGQSSAGNTTGRNALSKSGAEIGQSHESLKAHGPAVARRPVTLGQARGQAAIVHMSAPF